MIGQPIQPEWIAQVSSIASELDIPATEHGTYATALAEAFPAFAKWSPGLTNVNDVKAAMAQMRADQIAQAQEANRPKPDHVSAGGEMICNVPKAVWEKLRAADRMAIFRTWSASRKSQPGKPRTEISDHTKRRLRSEIHGAELTLTRLRGAERTQQIQRLSDLRRQLSEAGG